MKWVLWLLSLFAVAVASAFIVGRNEATVSLFWSPYRLDFSLNLVALLLILGFVFLHGVLRAVSALFDLPRQARRWRLLQKERSVHAALLDALALLLTGRYLRARKSAQLARDQERDLRTNLRLGESLPRHFGQLRVMADLIDAECAHALRDRRARDQSLAQALAHDPQGLQAQLSEVMDAARLGAARWALDDRDAESALRQMDELPRGLGRRTLALRLRLKASRLLRHHVMALETARLLTKHGAIAASASGSLLRGLAVSSLTECETLEQVSSLWAQLTPAETEDPKVARTAASRWLELGGDPAFALNWLLTQWTAWVQNPDVLSVAERSELTLVLAHALAALKPDAQWLQRLERAAVQWPNQAELLYLAACVFMCHGLWGKAQQSLERCATRLVHPDLRRQAGVRLAELAEQRGDQLLAAQNWKQAAQV